MYKKFNVIYSIYRYCSNNSHGHQQQVNNSTLQRSNSFVLRNVHSISISPSVPPPQGRYSTQVSHHAQGTATSGRHSFVVSNLHTTTTMPPLPENTQLTQQAYSTTARRANSHDFALSNLQTNMPQPQATLLSRGTTSHSMQQDGEELSNNTLPLSTFSSTDSSASYRPEPDFSSRLPAPHSQLSHPAIVLINNTSTNTTNITQISGATAPGYAMQVSGEASPSPQRWTSFKKRVVTSPIWPLNSRSKRKSDYSSLSNSSKASNSYVDKNETAV